MIGVHEGSESTPSVSSPFGQIDMDQCSKGRSDFLTVSASREDKFVKNYGTKGVKELVLKGKVGGREQALSLKKK